MGLGMDVAAGTCGAAVWGWQWGVAPVGRGAGVAGWRWGLGQVGGGAAVEFLKVGV